ncbi:Tn3 family transposase [Escherichia coli]|uniref:Tn3 family transposase n=2 Tax=Escherichia coli TaxID=562 RepID=UPI000F25C054|nr:Tn3 family transposase [Escherichia coli]MBE1731923.1 Tn3 family transposase [Escherichia coli]MBS4256974.1 Tn3 family transposase [Escherichia coli]VCW16919.1 Putative transposase (identified by ISEscan HMM) [Escherichia coli]HBV7384890.1 Tn3 family transposase [Escherichia coli]HBV7385042.1 Tn3 family transposase [Escherichia coli]
MPRRSILSAAERESLLALPDSKDDLIRHYTFNDTDLSIIRQRRGPANRLGFAVQLCYLRFPGVILGVDELPFPPLLKLVADQLKVGVESWNEYGQREQTRREHLSELQTVFGFRPFTMSHYRQAVQMLTELAMQTDKGIVLASALIGHLRRQSVILPALNAVERASAEAITRANRRIYDALAEPLADAHRRRLDDLLKRRDNGKTTWLAWLRQSPAKPNSRHMLEHIERLKAWQALDLPTGIERLVHQNRLLKIAREGGQMTPADLAKFEPQRRYATLVALATEGMATVTDEIIDLHDRILGKLFNAAKNKHQQQFQASGKAINAKVRLYGRIGQALIDAKQSGRDAFAAIEAVMSWDSFAESVTEAQKLAQPDDFDFLHRIGESYATLRRYAPEFLAVLKLRAAPAAKNVLDAIEVLRGMNTDNARKLPADAPTGFIKPRWQKLVMTDAGIDRRYYELCALSELKNSLRSGDIWVQGSRQFKDFEDYLVPPEKFTSLKQSSELPLAVATDCEQYLHERLTLLEAQLATVNRMAAANDLPDAIITESGLKITPLDAAVPDTAQALIDQTAMVLPHVKITELLLEVDEWTGFTRHFTHLKSGDLAKDKNLLLTTILATSIKQGTVTASLMLRKLGSYPRQNGLAVALRELGRIERTLFILDWLQSVELRRRVHAGLNKGEARNALARAVFFNRLGEIRDRSFEQQRYRASGLNLVTAAIVLWNTVYLERAAHALRGNGHAVDDSLLQYLSPLGWEHINLTGDYLWRSSAKIGAGKFRPLRPLQPA